MKSLPYLPLMAALLTAGCGQSDTDQDAARSATAPGAHEANISAGIQVAESCSGCHGEDGISVTPETPHLAGQHADYLARVLGAYKTGARVNAAMQAATAALSEMDIRDVSAYYADKPPAGSEQQMAASWQAQMAAVQQLLGSCASCHGADGNATVPSNPSLAGQNEDYLATALQGYRDGRRPGGIMETLASTLSDAQITALSAYYSAQKPVVTSASIDGDAERGKQLSVRCAACHGEDGNTRNATMPSLAGQDFTYLQVSTRAYVEQGREHAAMRTLVAELTEEDTRDLSAFYALQTPVILEVAETDETGDEPASLANGRKLAAGCAGCHGIDGNALAPGMPTLTGQHPDYMRHAIKSYRNKGRKHPMMEAMVAALSETDIQNLAIFYAVQIPEGSPTPPAGEPAIGRETAAACAGCHGEDGNSSKSTAPSLAGQDAAYLTASTTAYLTGDRDHSVMKASVEGLSAGEIQDLSAFYATQKPEIAPNVRPPLTPVQWAERCNRCHGPEGVGIAGTAPRIAGQREDYLRKSLAAYQDESRRVSRMHAMVWSLSDSEIDDLASYYAGR
ncbi:MAG: c-type cytochrome [Pseudomonadota bacterium]